MVCFLGSEHYSWLRDSKMVPKLVNLGISGSADELTEYISWFTAWIDIREASDEKAINGAFPPAVGKKAFSLLNSKGPSASPQATPGRTPFHALARNPIKTVRDFIVRLQHQSYECNFQKHLDVVLRDRLMARINKTELQREVLYENDTLVPASMGRLRT